MKFVNIPKKENIEKSLQWAAEHPDLANYPHPAIGPFIPRKEPDFWSYKCWNHVLEVAEKDSGLEEFFKKQDLHFTTPKGFVEEKSISMAPASDLMAVDLITDEFTPHIFDEIKDFWLTADLPTANLESTVLSTAPIGRNQPPIDPGAARTKTYPRMNTSTAMLDKFVNAGIRYFSLANNHTCDYDDEGIFATLDELDKRGVYHSGTNRREEDQEKAYIIEEQGIKIAMLNATFDTNSRHPSEKWMLNWVGFNDNPSDLSLVEKWIADAKAQDVDLIVLHAHWDWEWELYPHVWIEETAHKLCEMGVDVIVGSHPHVSHPAERYTFMRDGEEHQALIFSSLGDFVSFHPVTKSSRITYIPRFNIVKGTLNGKKRTIVRDLQILPIYILATFADGVNYDFRLCKFSNVLNDKPDANGNYKYPLQDWEREDLPHLVHVLNDILLPENKEGLIAD